MLMFQNRIQYIFRVSIPVEGWGVDFKIIKPFEFAGFMLQLKIIIYFYHGKMCHYHWCNQKRKK